MATLKSLAMQMTRNSLAMQTTSNSLASSARRRDQGQQPFLWRTWETTRRRSQGRVTRSQG